MDEFDLERFVKAQDGEYSKDVWWDDIIRQLKNGKKETHWMWFVFPQMDGIATNPSSTSSKYSIKSIEEAKAYVRHPILYDRLSTCIKIVECDHIANGKSLKEILGDLDAKKYESSYYLFEPLWMDKIIREIDEFMNSPRMKEREEWRNKYK